ncbi:MAG: DUF362 domain-containing protein [bacterium]
MKTPVAVVRTRTDYSDVERAVREAVNLIGGPGHAAQAGRKVLIKPNLLDVRGGESGMTTDRRVTAALVRMVREQGAAAVVGDSSGMRFHGASERVIQETGTRAACEAAGAQVVSFDSVPAHRVEIPGGRILKECHIARPVLEADVIITVPKLKTHTLTKFTGAVKNQLGCLPGGQKTIAHRIGSTPERFAHLLVDLHTVIRPNLALMDGVVGLSGWWRQSDRLSPGLIIAGEDSVAVDAVAAHIGGFDPKEIPTIRIAAERGLGTADLGAIDVVGTVLEELEPVPLAPRRFASILGSHLFFTLGRLVTFREDPKVNPARCVGCGHCQEVCPAGAVSMGDGRPAFDLDACIRCFCCQELCPQRAVSVDWGALGNWVMNRRAVKQSVEVG